MRQYLVEGYLKDIVVIYDTVLNAQMHGNGTCHLVIIPPGSDSDHCGHLRGLPMIMANWHTFSFGLPEIMRTVLFGVDIPNLCKNTHTLRVARSGSAELITRVRAHVNIREIVLSDHDSGGQCQEDVIRHCETFEANWRHLLSHVGKLSNSHIKEVYALVQLTPPAYVPTLVNCEVRYITSTEPSPSMARSMSSKAGATKLVMTGQSFVNVLKNFNMKMRYVNSLALGILLDSQLEGLCCASYGQMQMAKIEYDTKCRITYINQEFRVAMAKSMFLKFLEKMAKEMYSNRNTVMHQDVVATTNLNLMAAVMYTMKDTDTTVLGCSHLVCCRGIRRKSLQ
jgi:hypothetical protein